MERDFNVIEGRLKELIKEFLILIGEDPKREGLKETPARVARMWLYELTSGYRSNPKDYVKIYNISDYVRYEDLVLIRNVPVKSICEHHLLPFFGVAHLAYVPNGIILGFSKFARIIDVFAKRLQVQERLTEEVADFLYEELRPKGLMVVIEAVHTCALIRGVEEPMFMTTIAHRGIFSNNEGLRIEALNMLSGKGSLFSGIINGYKYSRN